MQKKLWSLLLVSCLASNALAQDCTAYQDALNSCLTYSTELDHQNEQLKQMLVEARKQTDEATKAYGDAVSAQSSLPWYAWVLIGGAVGAVGGRLLK